MVSKELEFLAEMQDEDATEILKNLTEYDLDELEDIVYDYFDGLLNDLSYEESDSMYERAGAAPLNNTTYRQREFAVFQFLNWYKKQDDHGYISKTCIRDWLQHAVSEGYSTSTMEARYWQFVSFLRDCGDINTTTYEEAKEADHKSVFDNADTQRAEGQGARPIEREEHQKILDEAENRRVEVMLRTLWQTGLRAIELVTLHEDDVELSEKKIHVDTAKDGEDRTLSINLELKNELRKWMSHGRHQSAYAGSGYLFPTLQSEHMKPRNFIAKVRNLADDAGVQDYNQIHQNGAERAEITVHSYRKSFGRRRLVDDPNSSTRRVQLLLGHSDVSTTEGYLELDEDDLDYTPTS